jgi:hypothetical protein
VIAVVDGARYAEEIAGKMVGEFHAVVSERMVAAKARRSHRIGEVDISAYMS